MELEEMWEGVKDKKNTAKWRDQYMESEEGKEEIEKFRKLVEKRTEDAF